VRAVRGRETRQKYTGESVSLGLPTSVSKGQELVYRNIFREHWQERQQSFQPRISHNIRSLELHDIPSEPNYPTCCFLVTESASSFETVPLVFVPYLLDLDNLRFPNLQLCGAVWSSSSFCLVNSYQKWLHSHRHQQQVKLKKDV
jgi:hypothetical protein